MRSVGRGREISEATGKSADDSSKIFGGSKNDPSCFIKSKIGNVPT